MTASSERVPDAGPDPDGSSGLAGRRLRALVLWSTPAIFAVSLALPVHRFGMDGDGPTYGISLLAFGWIGVVFLELGWLANPLLVFAWALVFRRRYPPAVAASAIAVLVAGQSLLRLVSAGTSLKAGMLVWLGSLSSMLLGATVLTVLTFAVRRAERADEPPGAPLHAARKVAVALNGAGLVAASLGVCVPLWLYPDSGVSFAVLVAMATVGLAQVFAILRCFQGGRAESPPVWVWLPLVASVLVVCACGVLLAIIGQSQSA